MILHHFQTCMLLNLYTYWLCLIRTWQILKRIQIDSRNIGNHPVNLKTPQIYVYIKYPTDIHEKTAWNNAKQLVYQGTSQQTFRIIFPSHQNHFSLSHNGHPKSEPLMCRTNQTLLCCSYYNSLKTKGAVSSQITCLNFQVSECYSLTFRCNFLCGFGGYKKGCFLE